MRDGELYLTEMAGLLRTAGERVVAVKAAGAAEVLGANTIADLACSGCNDARRNRQPSDGRRRYHLPP